VLNRLIAFVVGITLVSMALPHLLPNVMDDTTQADTAGAGNVSDTGAATPDNNTQAVPGYAHQVALAADESGHYIADATVNGISVEVIVDTGATMVALTADTARRLGIRPDQSEYSIAVSTANGATTAALVKLSHIRLGSVDVYDVEAAVMPPGALSINLLGMSFLNKLSRFQAGGGQLVLVQ
jgi:aspartyl protease family protein